MEIYIGDFIDNKREGKVKKKLMNIYMKVNLKMIKKMVMGNYHINY